MLALEISVNGRVISTCSISSGWITAKVNLVAPGSHRLAEYVGSRETSVGMIVAGTRLKEGGCDDSLRWDMRTLRLGDEVTFKVVDVETWDSGSVVPPIQIVLGRDDLPDSFDDRQPS